MTRKAKAVRQMGKERAMERMKELKKELLKFNSQIAVGTAPESPGKVKQVKKEIARILTILSERSEGKLRTERSGVNMISEPEKAKASKAPVAAKAVTVKAKKPAEVGKAK